MKYLCRFNLHILLLFCFSKYLSNIIAILFKNKCNINSLDVSHLSSISISYGFHLKFSTFNKSSINSITIGRCPELCFSKNLLKIYLDKSINDCFPIISILLLYLLQ